MTKNKSVSMDSDYYSTIHAWFERCGIISNVRTHLRHNLVNALKNKDIALNKANIGPKSAKQYIYDLLIAEYLWNHEYAYTLSVFASETPLLVNFHKYAPQSSDFDHGDKKKKMETDFVWHSLETLGIKPEGSSGRSIIDEYINNDIPLLLSVLKYISHSRENLELQCKDPSRYTRNCGTQTDFPKRCCLAEWSEIDSAKRRLVRDKEVYESRLRIKEDQLKALTSAIKQQMEILDDKLLQAKNSLRAVDEHEQKSIQDREDDERYIYRRKLELSVKESSLAREAHRLEKERNGYKIFETHLMRIPGDVNHVQQDPSTKDKKCRIQTHESSTQTQSTDSIMDKLLLDEEKRELRSLVLEQKSRIEVLTLRAVRLLRQLEEVQLIKCSSVDVTRPSVQWSKTHTVFSESSSTDEIIHDAKQRLKRLEDESRKADQCYTKCLTTLAS